MKCVFRKLITVQSKRPVHYHRAHGRGRGRSLAGHSCVAWVPAAPSAVRPLNTDTCSVSEARPRLITVTPLTARARALSHSPATSELLALSWGQQGQLGGTRRESGDSGTARRGGHT